MEAISEEVFIELAKRFPMGKSQSGKEIIRSARDLHEYLEIKTPYTIWFTRRVEEYGFVEAKDFLTILSESRGGRLETDANLTLDMTKELGMVERTEKGRIIRHYFIWAENKLRALAAATQVPTDYISALRQLADSIEQKALLQHGVE